MSVSSSPKPPVSAQEPGAQRRYVRPRLVRFGQLAEITAALGKMGGLDGGAPPNFKTGL